MNRAKSISVACLCVSLHAHAASTFAGVVTPTTSNRVVSALNRETLPQTQVSMTGPALGPWQAQVQAINDAGQPNYNPFSSQVAVTSSQLSDFSSSGVTFSGFVFIDYGFGSFPQLGTSATNRCDTTFHVAASCPYQLQATFDANSVAQFSNSIVLRNDSLSQNVWSLTNSGTQSGVLTPGDYTLSILIQGSSSGAQFADVRSQIDATFTIPAPASAAMLSLGALITARRRR